jgi:hypothetical protein
LWKPTNQPTNQHHSEQALTYQDWNCLQLYTARKLRSLAGSFVTCGICVMDARLEIFFWRLRKKNRNHNRNRNLCETRTWSFLSLPLQNRVGCERASERAKERHCISLFRFFRRFFFVFIFFPFKVGTNRVCTWLLVRTLRTYLPCMTFLLIARVFLSFSFPPIFPFSFFLFSVLTFFIHLYKIGFSFLFFPFFFSKHKFLVFYFPKKNLVFFFNKPKFFSFFSPLINT